MAKIVIVDDQHEQCLPLMRLLQKVGHDAQCFDNGPAVLDLLGNGGRPDLIICDVMMPHMDGAEVLRRVKAAPATATLPVVMFTAVSDELYQDHLRELGADDVWLKARTDFSQIEARIAELVKPAGSSDQG